MARLTLSPLANSLTGRILNNYLRATPSATLLVKPPTPPPPPTAHQLTHRNAWRRIDALLTQIPTAPMATIKAAAAAAGQNFRHYYLHHNLATEIAAGHAPVIPPNDNAPEIAIWDAQPHLNPGEIYFKRTQLPADPPYTVGWSARRQDTPTEICQAFFTVFPEPWVPAEWTSCTISGLIPGAFYSFSAHFVRTSTGLYGPSAHETTIMAKA